MSCWLLWLVWLVFGFVAGRLVGAVLEAETLDAAVFSPLAIAYAWLALWVAGRYVEDHS